MPPLQLFSDFAGWVMRVCFLLEEWEKENKKEYKSSDPGIELSLLSGMYSCGMTAEETAETLTATLTRAMTTEQLNVYLTAQFLSWGKKLNGEILGMLGREGDGKMCVIAGPKQHPMEFLGECAKYITEVFEKMEKMEQQQKDNDN